MNQAEIKKRRRSDEKWFKDTERHLGHYEIWRTRIAFLKKELERKNPKTTPNYSVVGAVSGGTSSDQTADVGIGRADIDAEIDDLALRMEQIDDVLKAILTEEEEAIVRLRFIEAVRDWQIIELSKVPLGKTLYYETRDRAMEKLAKCFGFLAC